MAILRSPILWVVAWLALVGGCAKLPDADVTSLKVKTLGELREHLLTHNTALDQFRLRGPFAVTVHKNHELSLSSSEHFNTDLFLSTHVEKAPLVIFLHGLDSSKEAHSYQAQHLASWGMHSLTLQLPNNGPWVSNGRTLAKIVNFIHRSPQTIDSRIDANKIILVGHSYGASSVAVALAEASPAAGGILLDPAAIGRDLPEFLQRINAPVMLIGADERVSPARNRGYFYRYIRSVSEVSIRDAIHEDAQYPSDIGLTTEELQITFVSALTSAALSLSSTGKFELAWNSFGDVFKNGKLFDPKKK